MIDYWLDFIENMNNMIHPYLKAYCGQRFINGENIMKKFMKGEVKWKDGKKCGGIILNIDNNLICSICGTFYGTAREKDKRGLEQGLVALLEEVIEKDKW